MGWQAVTPHTSTFPIAGAKQKESMTKYIQHHPAELPKNLPAHASTILQPELNHPLFVLRSPDCNPQLVHTLRRFRQHRPVHRPAEISGKDVVLFQHVLKVVRVWLFHDVAASWLQRSSYQVPRRRVVQTQT